MPDKLRVKSQIIKNYTEYFKTPKKEEILLPVLKEAEETSMQNENLVTMENKTHLTKIERLIVQELVQLPTVLSSVNLSELLDLVTSNEVQKYIGKVSRLILEIDESEYVSLVSKLTDSDEFSADLKEAAKGALYLYKPMELDKKNSARLLHDLKIKVQLETLKIQKEGLNQAQKKCNNDLEMQTILNQLTDIEKKIQILKKAKPEKK